MLKNKGVFFVLGVILLGLISCAESTNVLPKASGRANEVLVVIDDPVWDGKAGDIMFDLLGQSVDGLAWEEPLFDISRVNHRNYSEMLKIARNLIYIDVSNRYTAPKVKLYKDLHAAGQSFVRIQSPTVTELKGLLERNGNRILSFLYTSEKDRTINYFKKFESNELMKKVKDSIGIKMLIPSSFNRSKVTKDFAWMVAGNSDMKQYLAMYSYPYTDDSTFTRSFLINKRNEVLKANIPGPVKGSYMATGTFYPSRFKPITKNGMYCAELRGIWETVGDMMGGPYVSHTILDTTTQMVITVEGFLYAPHEKKRNHMRQLEALLETAHLPVITPQTAE